MSDLVKQAYDLVALRGGADHWTTIMFRLAQRIEALERERDEARATVRLQEGLLDALGAMARTEQAVRREALEEAAGAAKRAWLTFPHREAGDAVVMHAVCEHAEAAIRKLMEKGE